MSKPVTKEELTISNQERLEESQSCESLAYIPMKISTPISLTPRIKQLPITACISGEPVLEQTSCDTFILTQELCVKVPIEIKIKSNIGKNPPCCDRPYGGKRPTRPRYKGNPNVVIG